ncbi:MAG: YcgN family cysteine cluster protein [Alphaproteobacteria bacterium]|nr:YcgN family cysteine cluster protein [Alphaproteobacteria bacterium]
MSRTSSAAPAPFWRDKPFSELSRSEWESLCDGCGLCCLHKLDYTQDGGAIVYTNVACRLLDIDSCRCMNYKSRRDFVPDCISLTPSRLKSITWLPKSCAYRRLSEGRDLPRWHPLLTGDASSVHKAKQSIRGRAVAEERAGNLGDHEVEWPEI